MLSPVNGRYVELRKSWQYDNTYVIRNFLLGTIRYVIPIICYRKLCAFLKT